MGKQVIGIVGGMGSFATADFFQRVLRAFPAEKEWERPRVIIDNNCTMPSRVRAILYNEKVEEVINDLTASISFLSEGGATDIILACNTSHYFLNRILEAHPEFSDKIIHIIDECIAKLCALQKKTAYLIATEGTIDTGIYNVGAERNGIRFIEPTKGEQVRIRAFIEAVKQDKIDEKAKEDFIDFFNGIPCDCVVLGCTEIPILYGRVKENERLAKKFVVDPLECAIDCLKKRSERYERD